MTVRSTSVCALAALVAAALGAPVAAQTQTAPAASVPAAPYVPPAARAATPPPAAAPAPAAAAATAAPAKQAAAKAPAKKAERCFRLPLSDVAFGKEAAIAAARGKLQEYSEAEAKRRGWPNAPLIKSNETVGACELYLDFGPLIEKEYRCLVTATFCQK